MNLALKYKTRNGRPVRFQTTRVKGYYPIHGVVDYGEYELVEQWNDEGVALYDAHHNLEVVPAKVTVRGFTNVYRTSDGTPCTAGFYASPEQAKRFASPVAIAIGVPLTLEVEEGYGTQ